MQNLADLLLLSEAWLWGSFVVFLRIGAMVSVLPGFGDRTVPIRVKFGLAVAFTMITAPGVSAEIVPPPKAIQALLVYLAPEVLTGLFFGLALRFFIFALQIAGSIAAQSTSLAQIFGGSAGVDAQPAIGHILVAAGLALAALLGLHVQVASYMLQSYAIVPPAVFIASDVVVSIGLSEVSRAFSLGFQLSAPFLVASLVYNITIGVINRAMPQLMVSFVGAPAITAGSILLLMLSAPILLSLWSETFGSFMDNPFQAAR